MDIKDRMRSPRTLAGSAGTALLAVLVVGMVAFGATAIRPLTAGNNDAQTAAADRADRANLGHSGEEPTADRPDRDADFDEHKVVDEMDGKEGDEHPFEPKDEPSDEPKPDEPADEPKDEPADGPKDEPTDEPAPSDHLGLEAWVKEGKVKLGWSKYTGDGFAYYKVVRSKDATVSWPGGEDDTLVAAIADQWSPWAVDAAPCGKELHYRVFAVRSGEHGYEVLAASNVAGVFVECHEEPKPPVEPSHMGLDVWVTDAGAVKLAWEKCTSETFVYYKVVRSATNEQPMYPLGAGDELLAAIGDPYTTTFKDTDVEPGQTWFYRVLSFGQYDDGKVLLGMTDAIAVTVE